jgi:hypothetical protein
MQFIRNYSPSFDSVNLRIPLEKVKIVNPSLEHTWITQKENTGTGEVISDGASETRTYKHKSEDQPGIVVEYRFKDQFTKEQRTVSFLTVCFTSKILQGRYQEGINSDTIELVYNEIMNQGQVSFGLDDFLKGECTNVDIKKDFKAEKEAIREVFRLLKKNAKKHVQADRGVRQFGERDNFGFQFNDRKIQSPKEAPYLKIYSKELELPKRSGEFHREYLEGFDIRDVYRVEATVKNKKHFKSFGIEDTSLVNLLALSEDRMNGMISETLKANLQGNRLIGKKRERNMNSSTQFELGVIIRMLELGDTIEDILFHSTRYIENKDKRKYTRKKLQELYRFILEDEKGDQIDPERREQILQEIEDYERVISDVLGL